MNLQKAVIIAVVAALGFGVWSYTSRIDRTNPIAVATAFTKALKSKSTSKASSYYLPDQAKAWQTAADESIGSMKSGATDRFWESIPATPDFKAPTTALGITSVRSADGEFALQMTQVGGKWYVSKGPV